MPMQAPDSGVTVRMYRQGHGDCFLLAFRGEDGNPVFMLIDCGLMGGSQVDANLTIARIINHIREATGGYLHAVVVTHEHKDHVSGFNNAAFDDLTIGELWLAWTEDPNNDRANELREEYNDTLLGLVSAAQALGSSSNLGARNMADAIEELLELDVEGGLALGAGRVLSIKGITNKRAIKKLRDRAERVRFLQPHQKPVTLPSSQVRGFVLGPPEDGEKLKDMDPADDEGYHLAQAQAEQRSFLAAAHEMSTLQFDDEDAVVRRANANRPFVERYTLDVRENLPSRHAAFFKKYGIGQENHPDDWRQIDQEWLGAAESLAMRLNSYTNNTCLVLALELPVSKKVLLFVGDAQRGNWASWRDGSWNEDNGLDADERITVDDLLARTVLYKVGHHGSHNATLKTEGIEKMALGDYAHEFVAMIPANSEWAYSKSHPWKHPLKSLKDAILHKARGRVLQLNIDHVEKPQSVSQSDWQEFTDRLLEAEEFLQIDILDE